MACAVWVAGLNFRHLDTLSEIALAAPVVGVAVLLIALPRTERQRAGAACLLCAVAAGELVTWNAASRMNAESRRFYAVMEQASAEDAMALELLREELTRRHLEGGRPRVEVIGLQGPWQNLAMILKIEATNGYNPLRIGLYDRLVSPGEAAVYASARKFPATFNGYDCALARALGLEYIVMDRPIEQMPQLRMRSTVETLRDGPMIWIYRIPGAMPRVKFSPHIEVADADAVTASGELTNPPSTEHVVIDDETPPSRVLWQRAVAGAQGKATITSWRPGRIEIDVASNAAGVVVLHDSYYPGWIAEVDGRRVPILRADTLFRAVEVAPGARKVVFRFAPLSIDNLVAAAGTIGGTRRSLRPPRS